MSLRVWLPLNGDINNQGLSNITVTNNGATVDNNGKIGKCYSFDGTNDYLTCNYFINGFSQFTFAFWYYGTTTLIEKVFLYRGAGAHRFKISNGQFAFRDTSHSNQYYVDFSAIKPNTWVHVVAVYDNGSVYLYKDGVLDNSYINNTPSKMLSDLNEFRIGRIQSSSDDAYLNGKLNDFRIYDHALSQKEIKELSKGLVLHYKLDSNYSDIVYDCSGYCRNAIKYGNVTTNNSTPRNSLSTVFPDNTSYILLEDFSSADFSNLYTFSWWAKYTYTTQTMMWGYANGNKLNMYIKSNRYYWNSSGDGTQNPFGTISSKTYGDENWHHFAITGDGTTTKLYIDGEFKANATTYRGINGTSLVLNGYTTGTAYKFNGSLSDFRIYATALSDNDIKELYQTSASIDKDGNVFAYEFKED